MIILILCIQWEYDVNSVETVKLRDGYVQQEGALSGPDVVVPAVPALDLRCNRLGGVYSYTITDFACIPVILQVPVIKVPLESPSQYITGVASGTRSALVKADGVWYRLKGCGNDDCGFPIRTTNRRPGETPWRDIRGCAFPHTALTELYMADRVASALAAVNSCGANKALGYMLYADHEHLPLGKQFPTACILEETLGDRRLGTHVLAGLDVILPILFSPTAINLEALSAVFPVNRPRNEMPDPCFNMACQVVCTSEFVEDQVLAQSMAFEMGEEITDTAGLCWPIPRDHTTLANVLGSMLEPSVAAAEQVSLPLHLECNTFVS